MSQTVKESYCEVYSTNIPVKEGVPHKALDVLTIQDISKGVQDISIRLILVHSF